MVSLAHKLKMLKTCEKRFFNHIRVVVWKKALEKTPSIEEMRNFENRPPCQGHSLCKGYRLCKMVSLAHKLKMLNTCENRFYKHIRNVVCKKPLEKTPNIEEMRRF